MISLLDLNGARSVPHCETRRAQTHTWLTPLSMITALGPFDLDPCAAPDPRPWPTAKLHWTHADNALNRAWLGRVWLNPPYGERAQIGKWLHRMAEHRNGIALLFARTDTALFHQIVWPIATAVLFVRGRIYFCRPDGSTPSGDGAGARAPSVLIAYSNADADRLERTDIEGKFLRVPA